MTEAASKIQLARMATKALSLVNDARAALGMRRLHEWFKGYRHQADCCPVSFALTTGGENTAPLIDGTTALFSDQEVARKVAAAWGREPADDYGCKVVLPFAIVRFIDLFDQGHYPALTKSVVPERSAAA